MLVGKADGSAPESPGKKPDSREQQQLSTRGLPTARPVNPGYQPGESGSVGRKQPSDQDKVCLSILYSLATKLRKPLPHCSWLMVMKISSQISQCLVLQVEGHQAEISGFHAKRYEFDHEYDNDAELLISEIEFLPTDTPVMLRMA